MSTYAGNARERLIQITAPTDYGTTGDGPLYAPRRSTVPHITLSPRTARGLPTTGLALTLVSPDAGSVTPSGTGFTLTIFRAVPALGVWAKLAPILSVNFLDQLVLPDLSGGMGLFFGVSNVAAGPSLPVLIAVAELD